MRPKDNNRTYFKHKGAVIDQRREFEIEFPEA